MERISITLRGTKALLQNRMSPEALEQLRDKTTKKAKTATKPTPEEEAAQKVYTVDGKPVIPVENLMSCLIEAGRFIRLEGKKMLSNATSTVLPGLLSIEDDVLWLQEPTRWGVAEWRYDLRQGRNPNGGEAVAIVRPRFDSWAVRLTIQADLGTLPENTFRQLFDFAGMRVGLGDFRPQRKGIFGQFVVDEWRLVS